MSLKTNKSYLISAGELSGDLLAADLVHALRSISQELEPYGVVGEAMQRAAVSPIAHTSELSVMGLVEVAKKVTDIRMVEQRILAWVDRFNPAFAVLVDFPGFHFRLAEQLHLRKIPVYQYVAPKVWAWGQSRVELLRQHFAGVMGVLPFEEEFFLRHGVNYVYVGSPHLDRMNKISLDQSNMRLPPGRKIYAFLPGSRMNELKLILPIMDRIRREILRKDPEALCVIPLASGMDWTDVAPILDLDPGAKKSESRWESGGFVWFDGWSLELLKVAHSAVVASGTATLECALAGTPMSVVYVMNDLSYSVASRLVDLRWVSLVNLLMNEEVVKEHIQTIDHHAVAEEAVILANDTLPRRQMLNKFDLLASRLQPGAAEHAASWLTRDLRARGIKL
jgi:lipid-A-disaccharide synthase